MNRLQRITHYFRVAASGSRSSHLRRRAGSFPQPQECEAMAGIINDVGDEVLLGDIGFVEHHSGYLSTVTPGRSCFAPTHQRIDDRRIDIRVESNQIRSNRAGKIDPPVHTGRA